MAIPVSVRPFRRADREQLTDLVNTHVAAVVPGVSVSVNTLLHQLEREPDEYVVDPWVVDRCTLVAEHRDAVVAGALLLRYGAGPEVGDAFRDAGEIRWLVARPEMPDAANAIVAASLAVFASWACRRRYADGTLPAPAVYGIPRCWPHVRHALERAGFVFDGQVEIVLFAAVDALAGPGPCPVADTVIARSVGPSGTRFSAVRGDETIGFVEVETDKTRGGTRSRFAGWADIGNLWIADTLRRRGLATWLLGHAAEWARLGGADRLLAYAWPDEADLLGFLAAGGFRELVRTERGWHRPTIETRGSLST